MVSKRMNSRRACSEAYPKPFSVARESCLNAALFLEPSFLISLRFGGSRPLGLQFLWSCWLPGVDSAQ
jgi:hypothetical protein